MVHTTTHPPIHTPIHLPIHTYVHEHTDKIRNMQHTDALYSHRVPIDLRMGFGLVGLLTPNVLKLNTTESERPRGRDPIKVINELI